MFINLLLLVHLRLIAFMNLSVQTNHFINDQKYKLVSDCIINVKIANQHRQRDRTLC